MISYINKYLFIWLPHSNFVQYLFCNSSDVICITVNRCCCELKWCTIEVQERTKYGKHFARLPIDYNERTYWFEHLGIRDASTISDQSRVCVHHFWSCDVDDKGNVKRSDKSLHDEITSYNSTESPPRPAVPLNKLDYEHLDNGSSIDQKPGRKKRKAAYFLISSVNSNVSIYCIYCSTKRTNQKWIFHEYCYQEIYRHCYEGYTFNRI